MNAACDELLDPVRGLVRKPAPNAQPPHARRAIQTFASHIAWESEVWSAEDPDHMTHFNGERFRGPYPDVLPTNSPRSVPK